MTPRYEKRILQAMMGLACLVPICGGFYGMFRGISFLWVPTDVDSHFRYLSGLLLGIGFAFASLIPHIERHTGRMRMLTFIVVVGGMGRVLGLVFVGLPSDAMLFALDMELLITPLLCLWQWRVAKRVNHAAA